MDKFLLAKDIISGQEARGYMNIDGKNELMFFAKKVKADAEKSKKELKTLGNRRTQQKATGVKLTGSMTIYDVTPTFRKIMVEYIKKGIDAYFDMTIINEDPTSTIGKQTAILYDVNIDKVTMAQFDVDSDTLEDEVSFSYGDIEYLDEFTAPSNM